MNKVPLIKLLITIILVSFQRFSNASYILNVSDNLPPQSGVNKNNKLEGLIIELSKGILHDVKFVNYPLARAIDTTLKEKNTLLFISRTASREDKFYWISSVYSTNVYIYVNSGWIEKNGKNINNIKIIGVINASSLINTLEKEKYMGHISPVLTNEQNLKKLLSNRINGWIEGEIAAEYIINKTNDKTIKLERIAPIIKNLTWMATSKNSDLKFINDINKNLYKVILKKYKANLDSEEN